MKIDKFKNFELSNKVAELLDKCKTQELRDLISKKYHEYLNSKSKDRKFYIEDCSDLKFDVEIEEDFGEDVMVYYDKQMEDWMLGILEIGRAHV